MASPFIARFQRFDQQSASEACPCDCRVIPHTVNKIAAHVRNCVLRIAMAVLVLSLCPSLFGQTMSEVSGRVTDKQGLPVAGTQVEARNLATGGKSQSVSDPGGSYAVLGLPPGVYTFKFVRDGFTVKVYEPLVLTVNRHVQLDITLDVGSVQQTVVVGGHSPVLETNTSSTGETIFPSQLESYPLNGRKYLDLLQFVPGVVINRNYSEGDDNSSPILGERANNIFVLIDGMPNRNEVDGGPAAQFDLDSILEFQVLTSGYKAEFGRGSGGVVNVATKSGTDNWHGSLSLFHRNSLLDSADVPGANVPFLLRWDGSATGGGPILKDRVFLFGAAERVREARQSNFNFPADFPSSLKEQEQAINKHGQTYESRGFVRLDEIVGSHRLAEEMNLTNAHLTDQGDQPSLRSDQDQRSLMLGIHDTVVWGNKTSPYLLNAYFQYRGEPSVLRPAHLELGLASTYVNLFSGPNTGGLFGDVTAETVGPGYTPLRLDEQYTSFGSNLAKKAGHHGWKLGWDYQRARVDGLESNNIFDILFATVPDFAQYGLENAGVHVRFSQQGVTSADDSIALRNTYNGVFVQDDWELYRALTLNLGLRWDYDTEFPNKKNLSPRLGVAWSPDTKTVLSASWGIFYDHFRIGVARDVPSFGGARISVFEDISFPRLFYGDPTIAPLLGGLCLSPNQTDAQIAASGATCAAIPGQPLYGIDHLNGVVAAGHAPLPSNTIVTLLTVTSETGLTPQQFAAAASAAVSEPAGFFYWGESGDLSAAFLGARSYRPPIAVDTQFRTPYSESLHLGLQRKIDRDLVAFADYFSRDIRNILGARLTNLAFEARLPGNAGETVSGTGEQPISTYGPWYSGYYHAVIVGLRKQTSGRFTLEANYTYAHAIDNLLSPGLYSSVQTNLGVRLASFDTTTDSFVGVPPTVIDPVTGKTNVHGPFVASNGNPVPQAGKFYYGPNLDRGPSDLALTHTLSANGLVQLPKGFLISTIFRAQSGFRYSKQFPTDAPDVDGDGIPASIDFHVGRNHFVAPPFVNLDARLSKRFRAGDHVQLETLVECFNLLNRANPSQIQSAAAGPVPFGTVIQVLPGREGQVGIKLEF